MKRALLELGPGRLMSAWLGALALIAMTVAGAEAPAQSETAPDREEQLEEITVFGQRTLGAIRMQVQAARERVYDAFNALNSNDEFNIRCFNAPRTGTRIPERVCRPSYAEDATARAARELLEACRPDVICDHGISRAQGEQAQVHFKDGLLAQEFQRVMREHPEFRRAIAEYQELEAQYQDARGGRQPTVRASIVRVR